MGESGKRRRVSSAIVVAFRALLVVTVTCGVLLARDFSSLTWEEDGSAMAHSLEKKKLVSRIGFGSCTSRVAIDQPIWVRGVIPTAIDAWIWAGDIAYTDWPDVMCAANPGHRHCSCTRDWLRSNPDSCLAGDVEHARLKFEEQLRNVDYSKLVEVAGFVVV